MPLVVTCSDRWAILAIGGQAIMGLKLLENLKMRYFYVDVALYNVFCAELKVMIE